jgi:hypothetical protein
MVPPRRDRTCVPAIRGQRHGRTGREKIRGRKEICPTFSDCARVVKKNFPEKLSKIVVDGGGEQ